MDLGELKPMTISIQLVDRSVIYPIGILEDVLIRVHKFFITNDFSVLEMEEDAQFSIILGRHFLITTGDIIDVKNGKLSFMVGDKR